MVPSLKPYQDLSVQLEGEFFLRYSLFDLAGMCPIPGNVGRTSACHASWHLYSLSNEGGAYSATVYRHHEGGYRGSIYRPF